MEINSLTEFWLKLYACANSVYQAYIFHLSKIRRPGDKASNIEVDNRHHRNSAVKGLTRRGEVAPSLLLQLSPCRPKEFTS